MEKKREILRTVWILLFLAYLLLLSYLLFFSSTYGRTAEMGFRYNLKPFFEIRRGITYIEKVGYYYVLVNIAGNVVAFMPFGFLLPLISHRKQNTIKILFGGLFFSLCAETIQLVSRTGAFDVDDLILNTVGAVLGYWCFVLLFGRRRKKDENG
ncbi:MAG: VanZ family protein [Lachnospiraceae bacterium]|nr:VanZ family protein [Lachnospiraceae bacterium]